MRFMFFKIIGIKIHRGFSLMENARSLLGKRVRALRQSKNMTQQELGDEAEMNYKYLGAIERGERNPSIDNLAKIATALKVNLHELFIFEHETEDMKELRRKIDEMLNDASKKEFGTIYRMIKAILK
jgi:transcriptional regulator with XRE-family HTH domain